ncbi:MAG: hypothetical protein L0H64_17425, partial [Pseudonocardia sp.]|nr:hypothetical protein [Pseudonocardia sp.]
PQRFQTGHELGTIVFLARGFVFIELFGVDTGGSQRIVCGTTDVVPYDPTVIGQPSRAGLAKTRG